MPGLAERRNALPLFRPTLAARQFSPDSPAANRGRSGSSRRAPNPRS
jgi:hypothetical protein